MDTITMFIAFSVLVTMSSEVLKRVIKLFMPKLKVGLILAIIFGLVLSLSYGTGLLAGMFQVEYSTALFPTYFRIMDLIMSGLIYSLSSKAIIDLYELKSNKVEKEKPN